MMVVVNATPLIALALINQLDLLRQLFDEVLVPVGVYKEVVVRGKDKRGAATVAAATWLQVRTPQASPTVEPLLLGLDQGEFEVLLLAQEVHPDWVLIDERLGRRVAHAMGLPVTGTIGVLLAAARANLLGKEATLEAAQQLVAGGIRIGPTVMDWLQHELDKLP
jgi:predicted nucleic acid-binding protein